MIAILFISLVYIAWPEEVKSATKISNTKDIPQKPTEEFKAKGSEKPEIPEEVKDEKLTGMPSNKSSSPEKRQPTSDTAVVERAKPESKQKNEEGALHETLAQVEENSHEASTILQDREPKPKSPINPENKVEVAQEELKEKSEVMVSSENKPLSVSEVDKKTEAELAKSESVVEVPPIKALKKVEEDKSQIIAVTSPEEKPKNNEPDRVPESEEESKAKIPEENIPLTSSSLMEDSKKSEDGKEGLSPGGDVRSPVGDLAFSPVQSPEGSMVASDNFSVSSANTAIFSNALENALVGMITKGISSDQSDIEKEFKTVNEGGRAIWTKTHFIFAIDCSATMAGARWDSVTLGIDACVQRMKSIQGIYLSAFTFDSKVNPFCREKAPSKTDIKIKDIPFTGKEKNFKRPLNYLIKAMEKSLHKDFLTCILFVSDGLGGDIKEQLDKLLSMREAGSKFSVYTIGCEAEKEDDLIEMAKILKGNYYKLEKAEAARIIFHHILDI